MRAVWKLSVIVLLGVAMQWGGVRWANEIDEAAFTLRVFCATSAGLPIDDEELITAAREMFKRQCRRDGFFELVDGCAEEEVALAFACEE